LAVRIDREAKPPARTIAKLRMDGCRHLVADRSALPFGAICASYLACDNLTPLMRVADIAQPMKGVVWRPLRAEVTLSLEAFEATIRAELA
jgi:hypothetical protein